MVLCAMRLLKQRKVQCVKEKVMFKRQGHRKFIDEVMVGKKDTGKVKQCSK